MNQNDLIKLFDEHSLWHKEITLKRYDILKDEFTIDTNIYFIQNGSVRIFFREDEKEHIIRFGYTHSLIAALDSIISEKPSNLIIQTLKKTTIKVMKKSVFVEFISANENGSILWHKLYCNLILQQFEREQDLLITSPQERYKRVLQRSPNLFQEVPEKHIANYLMMSPETLSRLKKS